MAEILPIAVSDLIVDAENPRLLQPNIGQREAHRAIGKLQEKKLAVLASDIVQFGLNPADLPIVMPFDGSDRRYVVLEGNRRVNALKALEAPDTFEGAVESSVLNELRKLSKDYQESPIEILQCLVVKDRVEAKHWIELRHTGLNDGAGIWAWGSDEASRFKSRRGPPELHIQALDYLERVGQLTKEDRREVKATSLKRLIENPAVRAKLGLEVRKRELYLLADTKKVARALRYVVDDILGRLPGRDIKVGDIYTKQQRVRYAEQLPRNIVAVPIVASGNGMPITAELPTVSTVAVVRRPKVTKDRDILIPKDCVMHVTDARIGQIESELRRLSLTNYSNAASVLFRVFVELSCDSYIESQGPPNVSVDSHLSPKLQNIADHLVKRGKLTKQQSKPVKHACQPSNLLGPSIHLWHDYIHNQHVFPSPADLRAQWNSLQPFLVAIWSA